MSAYDSDQAHAGSGSGFRFPQIAAAVLIGYLVYRWYMSSSPSTPTQPSSSTMAASRLAVPRRLSPLDQQRYEQKAEVVHGMFPQISMGAIRWELLQNGGSVEVTTEKILANGFLREPPAQQNVPLATMSTSVAATSSASVTPRARTPASTTSSAELKTDAHTDLITRYNLHSKLNSPLPESDQDSSASKKTGKSPAWSQNKAERQTLLQKRRDEMILKARRRLEEDQKKKEADTAVTTATTTTTTTSS